MTLGTKVSIGMASLAIVGATAFQASAHDLPANADRPAWASKIHEAMDAGDYAAWKAAHQEKFNKMTTEERFNQLKTMHQLVKDGKKDEARQYAKDNNLPMHGGMKGNRGHHPRMMEAPSKS